MTTKTSPLPRSRESFRKLRIVRLVSRLFSRKRPKKFRVSSIAISSPHPASSEYPTMSLILQCRYLNSERHRSPARTDLLSSAEMLFRNTEFRDSSSSPLQREVDNPIQRSLSLESILDDDFLPRKMRTSRPKSFVNGSLQHHATSSLVDISNSALRSELESKVFVRAKRLNSGNDDPSIPVRSRADSTSNHPNMSNSFESSSSLFTYLSSSEINVRPTSPMNANQVSALRQTSLENMTVPLSHEAAKHRIYIRPKNRRPKTSYLPSDDGEKHSSLEAFRTKNSPITFNWTKDVLAQSVTTEVATVVSEVQATYEVLQPNSTPAFAGSPQPASRKTSTTMSYSKSFHIPRRPLTDSNPFSRPKPVSPRLQNRPVDTPAMSVKPLSANNSDEFMKVFSKFRKQIEADEKPNSLPLPVANSSTTSGNPLISQPSSNMSTLKILRTSEFATLAADITDTSGDKPVNEPKSVSLSPALPLVDLHLPVTSINAHPEVPSIDKMVTCSNLGSSMTFDESEQSVIINKFMATSPFKNDFTNNLDDMGLCPLAKSLHSPKLVSRQKSDSTTMMTSTEPELFKIMAKRSVNFQDDKSIGPVAAPVAKPVILSDSRNPVPRRSFSFKEQLAPTSQKEVELKSHLPSRMPLFHKASDGASLDPVAKDMWRSSLLYRGKNDEGEDLETKKDHVSDGPYASEKMETHLDTASAQSTASNEDPQKSVDTIFGLSLRKTLLKNQADSVERSAVAPVRHIELPTLRKAFVERKTDSMSRKEHFFTSGSDSNERVVSKADTKSLVKEKEYPSGSVSSRAAMFQAKPEDSKPISPRSDFIKPVLPMRVISKSPPVIVAPEPLPPLKPVLSAANSGVNEKLWSSPAPVVPLKPVVPLRVTNAQSSCTAAASNVSVPLWVILAQEKRNRISMLTENNDKENISGAMQQHVVDASYA